MAAEELSSAADTGRPVSDYLEGVTETTYSTVAPPPGGGRTDTAAHQRPAAKHSLSGKGLTPDLDGLDTMADDWDRLPP